MFELTENQKSALTRDKNIAVTAGAGTGKTLILVERYIDILLENDVDIRELLAITFTNKAASEMLSRVALKIETALSDSSEDKNHQKLLKIRNHLSSAYISTIHSFCSRLLREYPMEAGGLDPGFNTLNNIQSDFMIEECIDNEIGQLDIEDPSWLELFRTFYPDSIKAMLRVSLEHRFEMQTTIARFSDVVTEKLYDELKDEFFRQVTSEFTKPQLDQIHKAVIELLATEDSDPDGSSVKVAVIQGFEKFKTSGSSDTIEFWIQLFYIAQLLTTNDGRPYKNLAKLGGQNVWKPDQKDLLVNISNLLSPIAIWQKDNSSSCPGPLEITIIKNLKKYYELYQKVEVRYSNTKRKQDSIDFDDIQLMTYQLLRDNEQIRNEVAGRFKYIMVDEFQDTNILQWRIIELISDENKNNVFIVGDPKQSIYGFRNADVRVFNSVKKKLAEKNSDSDLLLYESFRFKKEITAFINFIFPKIMQIRPDNHWEVGYEMVETKREDEEKGQIELALLNKIKDENVQAKFIASHILNLLSEENYKAGDIAIMLRSRTHLSEIENILREYGIPFQTIGGIGFYQGQEIYDTYYLLKFLMDPNDDMALVGLLRSPLANISDEGLFFLASFEPGTSYWQKLQHLQDIDQISKEDNENLSIFLTTSRKWLSKRDRIGYFELLSDIFNESFYRALISSDFKGEQIIANIDKILNIVLEYEKGRFTSIVDFAESLNRLINTYQKEGEAFLEFEEDNSVKIMTIHQAKGLEYPVVFLPYLNQKLNTPGHSTVYFDDYWGVISNASDQILKTQNPVQNSFYLHDLLKLKLKTKEIAELKRLFYVGCTRARNHLILCAELSRNKIPSETPLSWLMAALELTPEELPEEELAITTDLSIKIYKNFSEITSLHEKERKKTIQSLDELERILPEINNDKLPPVFLTEIMDKPEGEIFSATQLMTFLEDKNEYHKRYHLGFFEDDYEKIGMGKTNEPDALLRGVLLHRLMENYPERNIDRLLDEVDLSDDQIKDRLSTEIRGLVEQIDHSQVIISSLKAKDFKNEASIIKQVGVDFITGTLDRIYKNENKEWVVLDYKTNHLSEEKVPQAAHRYQVQIEIYALLIASVYREQEVYPVSLYFIYPDILHTEVFDKKDLQSIEEKFEGVIREIKQFYPYTEKSVGR